MTVCHVINHFNPFHSTYQVSNIHNTSLLALLLPSTATSILQDCEENADVKIGEEEVAHQDYKYRTKEKRECPYDSNTFTVSVSALLVVLWIDERMKIDNGWMDGWMRNCHLVVGPL